MQKFAPLLALLVLSGCATLSKSECQVANWQAIGYTDGTQGHYPDHIMKHAKACGKIGITPDSEQWETGRQAGLAQYCTTSNAYTIGSSGRPLNAVCPAHLSAKLTHAHAQGREIYLIKQEHYKTQTAIEKHEKDIAKLTEDYKRLMNGENLGHKSEKDARAYMMSIPSKINELRKKINEDTYYLKQLNDRIN